MCFKIFCRNKQILHAVCLVIPTNSSNWVSDFCGSKYDDLVSHIQRFLTLGNEIGEYFPQNQLHYPNDQ